MEYNEFLKTKKWKDFRNKNIKTNCEICGNKEKLNLHHLDYKNLFNEYLVSTVCQKCHKKIHFSRNGNFYSDSKRIYERWKKLKRHHRKMKHKGLL